MGYHDELMVIFTASLPITELRGAIPLALAMDMSIGKAFLLSIGGNLVPVVPILLLLEPISNLLRRFSIFDSFLGWLFKKTRTRSKIVERYEAFGLMVLVAIPLPMTGAWTGCVAAHIFGIRFIYAFPAIACGILIAGGIVSLGCMGVLQIL